jgi:hypothetical protein
VANGRAGRYFRKIFTAIDNSIALFRDLRGEAGG